MWLGVFGSFVDLLVSFLPSFLYFPPTGVELRYLCFVELPSVAPSSTAGASRSSTPSGVFHEYIKEEKVLTACGFVRS